MKWYLRKGVEGILLRSMILYIALGFFAGPQVVSAEEVKLSVTHLGAITTPIVKRSLGAIISDLEATGKVKVTTYGSGSAYGNPRKFLMQVERGIVDMAFGTPVYFAGQLPLNLLIMEPFVVNDPLAASRAYMKLIKSNKALAEEWPETVKVLQVFCISPYQLHTRKPVKKFEDVSGLRIQVSASQLKNLVTELGGSVAALPIPSMYENLQKGVVDGGMAPWPGLYSWKLLEVTKYHLGINISAPSNYLVINQKKYDSLPDEVKAVLDSWSTPEAVVRISNEWNKVGDKGIEEATQKGHEIVYATQEERMALKKRFQYLTDKRIADLEAKGLPARQVYDDFVTTVAAEEAAAN